MYNRNLVFFTSIAHLVEFCPVEVFSMIVEAFEEIEKDDTLEGSFRALIEITYDVLDIYNQILESDRSIRFTPFGEEIDQKQRDFCEFILTVTTRVIMNSGDVVDRMVCLTIIQVLFGNPKLSDSSHS